LGSLHALALEVIAGPHQGKSAATAADVVAAALRGMAQINHDDYPGGYHLWRQAAAGFIDMVERGETEKARRVTKALIDAIGKSEWNVLDIATAIAGSIKAEETGVMQSQAHLARLRLFCQSDARFPDLAGWAVGAKRPPEPSLTGEGILKMDHPQHLVAALNELKTEGYHVFANRVPDALRDRLLNWSKSAPALAAMPDKRPGQFGPVDLARTDVDGFAIDSQALIDNPDIQSLIVDSSFWAVAQNYLGVFPVFTGVAMRWSLPSDRPPNDEFAQFYHWDADFIRWLKIFFFLTDVDANSGPHVYVRGTHRPGTHAKELRDRFYARIPDADIERIYGKENIVTALVPGGSIVAGDTRAWHKGEHPTKHPRCWLQLQFASSLMMVNMWHGKKLKIRPSHTPKFLEFVGRYPEAFPSLYWERE
jgi:hypothetical protein